MFGSPPPQPNFVEAAKEQAAAGRQLTAEQTYANRPDISTPWGGVRWTPPTYDPWFGTGGSPPGGPTGGGGGPTGGGGGPDGAAPSRDGGLMQALRDNGFMAPRNAQGNAQGAAMSGPPGRWGMDVYLSPEQQAAMEAQQRIQTGRSSLAESLLGRAQTELGAAPDFSTLPETGGAVSAGELPQFDASGAPAMPDVAGARNRAEEALYQRQASRLNPEWEQRQQQLDVQLRSQGVLPGSPAYMRQMADFERAREAAFSGARQESIMGGGTEAQREFGMGIEARRQAYGEAGQRFGAGMQREGQRFGQAMQASQYAAQRRQAAMAEMLQRRGWSLNEINALLSGQQVGMPQMPGFNQAGVAQAPNLLGAAQSQYQAGLNAYNAQQAQLQSLLSGGFGLAGIGLAGMTSPYSF